MTDPSATDAVPSQADPAYRRLLPGDRFPTLHQACGEKAAFSFDACAGRYLLFGFFVSSEDPQIRAAVDAMAARHDLFEDRRASFFGVSIKSDDRDIYGLPEADAGVRFVWDFDRRMSGACGVTPLNRGPNEAATVFRKWVLVDPSMHVLQIWPMRETSAEEVLAALEALPPPDLFGGVSRPAPVLMLPNVLEPELCRSLIQLHESQGGRDIGFYRGGKLVTDPSYKRRLDVTITDRALIQTLNEKLGRRILPEIEKLFFMRANFVERHLIGCYSAQDGGHFRAHTDNGDPATAHRRFAVSINLNDGFEGGEIVFPEYNMTGYTPPAGWAVVFPCAILHAVRQVTSGVRYAFLPFLYDESGRLIREAAAPA